MSGLLNVVDKKNEMWMSVIEQQQQVAQNHAMMRELEAKESAIQKGKQRLRSTVTWLTKTHGGLAVATMVITCVLLIMIKPDFVKKKRSNHLEDPGLSLGRILMYSVLSSGTILLVPAVQTLLRCINKHKVNSGMC